MNSPFTDEMLNNFRQQGDPLADEVIDVFASQFDSSIELLVEKLINMFSLPVEGEILEEINNHFPDDEQIQNALKKYFTQAVIVPEWVDSEKLVRGTHVFQDHIFSSIMILGCASLPTTYVCQPDTKVLGFTRRLINNAPKRLIETAQMVTDMMAENGLSIHENKLSGKGVQSILKIRLIHASVRHLMLHKEKLVSKHAQPDSENYLLAYVYDSLQDQCNWSGHKKPDAWDVKTDGIPINNEALAIILLTFSYTILKGLKTIGVKLTPQNTEAYLHSWNVVGYLLGVDEVFLNEFTQYNKTEQIYEQIMDRRRGNSHDGVLLEQALLGAFSETARRTIPTPFAQLLHVKRVARLITSKLISKKSYTALNLELGFYDRIVRFFVWTGVRFFGFLVNYKFLRTLSNIVFSRIAKTLWDWRKDFPDKKQQHLKRGGHKPLIIPDTLVRTSYLSEK